MTREEVLARISIDPNGCFGRACNRGTRIWVALILEHLADGVTEAGIPVAYPQLQVEDIQAALADAAEAAREHVLPVPVAAAKA